MKNIFTRAPKAYLYVISDYLEKMDVERIAMFAGVGFALGIGAFVLWGPSPNPRRRGQIAGITNLGHTCFMNSLLQSLAAVPIFTNWLTNQRDKIKSTSFTSNLASVLDKVNGFDEDLYGDIAPIEVITSLGSLWRFGSGHQDAHELFHIFLSALQSETQPTASRKGCLSDALPDILQSPPDPKVSNDFGLRSVSCNDIAQADKNIAAVCEKSMENRPMIASTRSIAANSFGTNKPGVIIARSAEIIGNIDVTNSFRSWSSLFAIPQSNISVIANEVHPFSGLLTSQLQCTGCKFKSPVRYDKLESVSLPLPPAGGALTWRQHTLAELLSRLVTSEVIHNVECDRCSNRCPAVKTLTIGKLPRCLCLHIPRTAWSNSGVAIKRDDPVIFPEILILDPFTFAEASKRNLQGGIQSMPLMDQNVLDQNSTSGRHRYRLQAVLEHRGPVDAGHFVSYRRGNRVGQWIYASDTTVERISLTDVLCASPYLLFYERIASA